MSSPAEQHFTPWYTAGGTPAKKHRWKDSYQISRTRGWYINITEDEAKNHNLVKLWLIRSWSLSLKGAPERHCFPLDEGLRHFPLTWKRGRSPGRRTDQPQVIATVRSGFWAQTANFSGPGHKLWHIVSGQGWLNGLDGWGLWPACVMAFLQAAEDAGSAPGQRLQTLARRWGSVLRLDGSGGVSLGIIGTSTWPQLSNWIIRLSTCPALYKVPHGMTGCQESTESARPDQMRSTSTKRSRLSAW